MLMTPFYCPFNFCYPFVQMCKIGWKTFSTSHKNQDPSPLQVQKSNRMKYDSQIEWVSSHSEMITHVPHVSLKSHWCHQCLASALDKIFHNLTCQPKKNKKIAITAFPNYFSQVYLPWASIPLMTSFHHLHFHCSILMEVGHMLQHTFSNMAKIHDPSLIQV